MLWKKAPRARPWRDILVAEIETRKKGTDEKLGSLIKQASDLHTFDSRKMTIGMRDVAHECGFIRGLEFALDVIGP